jgi:hypothetical protein
MAPALNTFADFIADFPYQPGWTEDPSVEVPGKDVTALFVNGVRGQDHCCEIDPAPRFSTPPLRSGTLD